MARFRHRLRARYSECDPQGVVFNANYLDWFDVAITELWREALGPYGEVMGELGVDMVLAEASIRYHAGIRFDQEVELGAGIAHLGTTSMITGLMVEATDGGGRAAEGELRHVFVRFGTTEKTPIPPEVRQALEPYLAGPGS